MTPARSLFSGWAVQAANALVGALLAPCCAVCDAVLDEPLKGCVCMSCWTAVQPFTPPVCDRCGDPLPREPSICSHCRSRPSPVDRARAVGEYDGTLREIIHALKYSRRHSLAKPMAALMQTRGIDLLEHAECIVPVPLHWRREYQRGFNQARSLAANLNLPIVDALVRRRHTRAQVELAADRRYANVSGAFALRGSGLRRRLAGTRVVLVDDVSTTGATLESCARVLKDAGASEVWALTAARVVSPRLPGRAKVPGP